MFTLPRHTQTHPIYHLPHTLHTQPDKTRRIFFAWLFPYSCRFVKRKGRKKVLHENVESPPISVIFYFKLTLSSSSFLLLLE